MANSAAQIVYNCTGYFSLCTTMCRSVTPMRVGQGLFTFTTFQKFAQICHVKICSTNFTQEFRPGLLHQVIPCIHNVSCTIEAIILIVACSTHHTLSFDHKDQWEGWRPSTQGVSRRGVPKSLVMIAYSLHCSGWNIMIARPEHNRWRLHEKGQIRPKSH